MQTSQVGVSAPALTSLSDSQLAQAPPLTGAFAGLIDNLLHKANSQQALANHAIQDLATGKTDNIHDVMIAVSRADLSFRFVLEIRNRLSDALQEVLRMQV